MEEWGRPAQQPRTPLPPRRSVPPGTHWWEPTERCPGGRCESEDRVRWRVGHAVSHSDSTAVRCYHCRHWVCLECGVAPVPGYFQFCEPCSRDFVYCDYCCRPHSGPCCATWGTGPILSLDTETTGKDPHSAELVSVSVVEYRCEPDGQEEKTVHTWLVDAGCPIPEAAARIHGITTADVRRDGRPIAEALTEISAFLALKWTADTPLCAFNAPYDLTVLDQALRRHLGSRLKLSGPVIDPQSLEFGMAPSPRRGGRLRIPSLAGSCATYRVAPPQKGFHDASQDALAAARLACALARHEQLIGISLDDLQHRQRRWKGRLEARFRHPRALVEEAWPLEYANCRSGVHSLSAGP